MKKENLAFAPDLRALLFATIAILSLSPSIFAAADWQPAVGVALLIPAIVIAIAYMAISALHIEHYKQMLHDEAANLVLTALIALIIIAGMGVFENLAGGIVCASSQTIGGGCTSKAPAGLEETFFPYCSSMNYGADGMPICSPDSGEMYSKPLQWADAVNKKQIIIVKEQIAYATEFNAKIGAASSVSGFCNMVGVGLGIAGCSAYGTMRGPVSQLIMALGTGLMELEAIQILLGFISNYALTLLLPLGVILRSIHVTRKMGGTIIALSLSLYLVFPAAILISQSLADQFLYYTDGSTMPYVSLSFATPGTYPSIALPGNFDLGTPSDYECNPFEPSESKFISTVRGIFRNSGGINTEVVGAPAETSIAYKLIFIAIVRTLLMGALVLTLTILAVRAIGKELGAEVDASAIARLS